MKDGLIDREKGGLEALYLDSEYNSKCQSIIVNDIP
jgi:hypothetical protein